MRFRRCLAIMAVCVCIVGCGSRQDVQNAKDDMPDVKPTEEHVEETGATIEQIEDTTEPTGDSNEETTDTIEQTEDRYALVEDTDGHLQFSDGSSIYEYTTDGSNIFDYSGAMVSSLDGEYAEQFFRERYCVCEPERLFQWYGWDWTEANLGELSLKEFTPYEMEYGYSFSNGDHGSIRTPCIGSDPDSIFTSVKYIVALVLDGNVKECYESKIVTDNNTTYVLSYNGKRLSKISTTIEVGGETCTIYYKIYDKPEE